MPETSTATEPIISKPQSPDVAPGGSPAVTTPVPDVFARAFDNESGVDQPPVPPPNLFDSFSDRSPDPGAGDSGGGDADGGGGNGGGGEGDDGNNTEGPRNPEGPRGPEWLTSPERGRWLVEQIVEMETTLPYEIRYNAENGPKLNRLYANLREFVEGISKGRYDEFPFDSTKEHLDVGDIPGESLTDRIVRAYQARIDRVAARVEQEAQTDPEDFTNVESLDVLIQKYNTASATERPQVENDLLKYFREAKKKGLLKGVDDRLNAIYLRYAGDSISAEQARAMLLQETEISTANNRPPAYVIAESAFRRKMGDPEVNPRLRFVGQAYIQVSADKFEGILDGEAPPDYREGEWRSPTEQEGEETSETYWEPSAHYPRYYEITAQTPDQFRIATQTFLQMIKNKGLGYAPDELMDHYRGFKDKLGAVASDIAIKLESKPEGPDKMTAILLEETRQEFEGQFLLWYAYYNGEVYNREGWKQGMTAMALHEGPQRWIRVARSGNGGVGEYSYQFDNEKTVELAWNAQGSRGQLGGYSVAQSYMRIQIYEIMRERGMGVVLKNYDRRDGLTETNPQIRRKRAELIYKIEELLKRNGNDLEILSKDDREKYREARKQTRENQELIGIHQSEEAFKSLFEGFDSDGKGFIIGDTHLRNFEMFGELSADELKLLPKSLRDSIILGRIQQKINTFRAEARNVHSGVILSGIGQFGIPLVEIELAEMVKSELISEKDKKFYEKFLAKSKVSWEIAYEMQGATQEKAIRGGGVYFVYSNGFVQEYQRVRGTNDSKLSLNERKEWTSHQHLGWIIDTIAKGTRIDTLDLYEKYLYYGLGEFDQNGRFKFKDQATENQIKSWTIEDWEKLKAPADRENIVDHIPIHLAVKFVQAAVNWTKMKYADDALIWQREDLVKEIKKTPNFRALYRTAMVNQAQEMAVEQIWTNGYEAKLYDADYEVANFDEDGEAIGELKRKGDLKPMEFLRPNGAIDPQTGKMVVAGGPEKTHLDFDTAVKSYLALHTTHTYWAYQNNNTHTLIPEYVVVQARQIRDGELRFEDADIFAGLLLTLDPTLCRVRGFPGEQMSLEGIVFDAAVEDSYMSWVRVRNGLKEKFLPEDGNSENMGAGYYIEDFGGEARFALQIEALTAKMPKRWARRFAAALSQTPMHVSTMADNLGRKGVLGVISMMDDKIHGISDQRILSQFAITKFINLVDTGSELWLSLVGGIDPKTGESFEGVFEKPTNNNDKLVEMRELMHVAKEKPEVENQFEYKLIESFGRVDKSIKIIRKMYSDQRNAGGALLLDKTDVFLPDGRYNPAINTDGDTGSSRHIARMFWDAYVDWLLDTGPGGGAETYPESVEFYKFLNEPYFYYTTDQNGEPVFQNDPNLTWSDWIFRKIAR